MGNIYGDVDDREGFGVGVRESRCSAMPQLLVTVDGALFYVLFLSLEEDRPCFGIFSITIALCVKWNTYIDEAFFFFKAREITIKAY